jgi:hypothetical protein
MPRVGAGAGGAFLAGGESAFAAKLEEGRQSDAERKRVDMLRAKLKRKMREELKNSRENQWEVSKDYKTIMRQEKIEELLKDVQVMSQQHARDVDQKDGLLHMLDRDLNESEEQFQAAQAAHVVQLQDLLELQAQRAGALRADFDAQLEVLTTEYRREGLAVERSHNLMRSELEHLRGAVEAEHESTTHSADRDFRQREDELRGRRLEDSHGLQDQLNGVCEDMEDAFDVAHEQYMKDTEKLGKDYKEMERKNASDARMNKRIDRRIERLQRHKRGLEAKMMQIERECSGRNGALQEERDNVLAHFQGLKVQMNTFRQRSKQQLATLARAAEAAKKTLGDRLRQAETIVKHAEHAKLHETEREQVFPFAESSSADPSAVAGDAAAAAAPVAATAGGAVAGGASSEGAAPTRIVDRSGNPVEEWAVLDRWHTRYNRVVMDRLALQQQRDTLKANKEALQTMLRQYLDGISVSKDIMDSANPLLVVNGNVHLNRGALMGGAPNVVVEAAHVISSRRAVARR